MSWRDDAACVGIDPSLFDPVTEVESRSGSLAKITERTTKAKAVCNTCPVTASCRAAAVAGDESGVWGGELFAEGKPATFRPRGRPAFPHGTAEGYERHRARKTKPCAECQAAWETAIEQAVGA